MKKTSEQEFLEMMGTDPDYLGSGADLARFAANLSGADLARIKKIRDSIPVLKNPYTMILKAITDQGCSLEMSKWHTCKTTHCLGGWTVMLAGEAGAKLESFINMPYAAAAILLKSRPDAPLPYFCASNEAAMAFIKARAAEEV